MGSICLFFLRIWSFPFSLDFKRQFDDEYRVIVKSYSFPPESLQEKPKPIILSKEWFSNRKKRKTSRLPPFLQFRFPMNIVRLLAAPVSLIYSLSTAFLLFSPFLNTSHLFSSSHSVYTCHPFV